MSCCSVAEVSLVWHGAMLRRHLDLSSAWSRVRGRFVSEAGWFWQPSEDKNFRLLEAALTVAPKE
jgi:hypothetical protein